MTSDAAVVVVTGTGPQHRHVANALTARTDVAAVLTCAPPPRRAWHEVLRRDPRRFVDKAALRVFQRAVGDDAAEREALADVLGPGSQQFDARDVVDVGPIRSGVLEERVRELAPAVLAVYGTGIVPDAVLEHAGVVALNMHTGISPRYRGTACAFWPIHNEEPEWLGATVHECTSDVDGGRIFATAGIRPERDDTLHHVFARTVRSGAQVYGDVVETAVDGTLAGEVQDLSTGTEYRGRQRGLRSELVARRNLARMRRGWPAGA